MARHVMTPARRAALRKAQIASARKRRKGLKGKVKTFAKTARPKRKAHNQLLNANAKAGRKRARVSRIKKKATKTRIRSTAARNKSSRLASKSKRLKQKATRIQTGKQGAYKKRRKARRKAIRKGS